MDTFEFCWFRHDAHKASSWFQRSIVYFASPQKSRESSLLPKLVAKLFFVLVELITATMDPALIDRGNLRKRWLGQLFVDGVSKLIWCKSYSDNSVTANAVYCHRRGVLRVYLQIQKTGYGNTTTKTITMTRAMKTSMRPTTAWTTDTRNMHITWACTESAQSLSHFVHLVSHAPHGSSSESHHFPSMYMCVSPWVHLSHLLLRSVLTCLLLFLPPPALRAAHWARQPDRLAKLALFREQGSDDAYDVHTSLTGYEPNVMAFSESTTLQIPSPTLSRHRTRDMDDVTLGKLLTEAHRGLADYCDPEGVSVSQSSSVVFDRAGKRAGDRDVDQSFGFGVMRNTYSAHSKFSENTQAEKVVDRSGKPEEAKQLKCTD